ncbi:type II secretion system F family protein [Paraburkholderia caribensis]|uniref:Type II secretion system F family protein n=1 Tax=Paraburkholderia caribensis TaxID=75105 RepID=A0A9Q6WNA7_9BURK|nr:type II secretion system F family protein [Paraburkholderia caribensis]MCO4877727.1 type II secretion system F family protein [Paraburkholderia caribensis]PTB28155.1 type II secretion system protein [Paraburkholderia caribensis]QLB64276.1 type II secretion system protein [Paraburkholderia caribensis]
METEQLALLAAMFAIVFGAAWKAMSLLRPDPLKRRIDGIAASSAAGTMGAAAATPDMEGDDSPAWMETVTKVSQHVAKLSLPKDDWDKSALRRRFATAGMRGEAAPAIYFAAKTLLALVLPALALLGITLFAGSDARQFLLLATLSMAALGFYLPNVVLSRLVEMRQRSLFEDLPDALDLMTVCVEAGLGLDAAMQRVAEEIGVKSHALKEELELVLLELRAGAGRDKALRNLALRTGVEDIDTLTSMLIQADRFGTSVGDSLRVFVDTLRTKRRLRAEEQAAKIALKLLFPLMFCIFPTLIMVLIGPAAMQVARQLLPTMGGMH